MQALAGMRVIELGAVVSVPYCGQMMAELGADVIRIESPEGDQLRRNSPAHRGMSAYFYNVNRGKRATVVDLRSQAGRELVHRLIATADVVVENWRPGVAERLGFAAAALRQRHPRLVTASIRGFGDAGPYADGRVYDPIIQGVSAMAATQDDQSPRLVTTILPDKLASMALLQGVLAALVQRSTTGEGDHVSVSMLDAAISFLWPDMMQRDTFADADHADVPRDTRVAQMVRCGADDKWVLCTATTEQQWKSLCSAVGRPEWVELYPGLEDRRRHRDRINADLGALFADRARPDVLRLLSGAQVPCGPLNTVEEMLADPQVVANRTVRRVHRAWLGEVLEPVPVVMVGEQPWTPLRRGAPEKGEHDDEIRTELESFERAAGR